MILGEGPTENVTVLPQTLAVRLVALKAAVDALDAAKRDLDRAGFSGVDPDANADDEVEAVVAAARALVGKEKKL